MGSFGVLDPFVRFGIPGSFDNPEFYLFQHTLVGDGVSIFMEILKKIQVCK